MGLLIKDLWVSVDNKEILQGVSLEIEPGEVVALMGPNGSGKSSLAYTAAGHPKYEVKKGSILIDGEEVLNKSPDERAKLGLFLAFQYPVAIPGVTVREVLLAVLREKEKAAKKSALELKKELEKEAELLSMNPGLLSRGLNEGFSGGEKKKMEIMQLRILKPKYAILDETDSGLDIDALKIVAEGAQEAAKKDKVGILVITHYQRILKYLKPDRVVVLKEGVVAKEGGEELVRELEDKGYKLLEK
jgi:Fe-S cluster assembly ATP-binding protein